MPKTGQQGWPMNVGLIPIIWLMMGGVSLALALMHLLFWLKNRAVWANLLLSLVAASLVEITFFEMSMMLAETPAQFGTALRWVQVGVWTGLVSLTGFVLFRLQAGRLWLAATVCVLRTASLIPNFLVGQNLNYLEISHLKYISFLGESVAVAEGVANPWMLLGQVSLLLFLIFIVDAMFSVWRRGDRRLVLVTGGSVFLFMVAATTQAVLVLWQIVQWPLTTGLLFMIVVVAMSYELSRDVLQAARLAAQLEKSEGMLRLSERRFDQAADAARVGTWEWNVIQDEIWATDQARTLFGFQAGQRLDLDVVLSRVHPDDRDIMRLSVMRSIEEGGSYEREYRIVLPSGAVRWIVTRGRVETDAGGKSSLMRGISIDITERKHTEERFRRVVESAPIGIVILNSRGRIDLVNTRVETDFGYSREELIGLPIETLIPERFRARHNADRAGFLVSPSSRMMAGRDVVGRCKDGSEIPLEIELNPVQTSEGSGIGVLATIVNVSERKQYTERLEQERAFLRQVIDISPNLIFAKDRQGRFTLVNKAVANIYGTTVDDLIGKSDADFDKNADEVEAFRRADLEVMDTLQEKLIPEERITDAEGKVHWLQTVKQPIMSVGSTATQILGTATDITMRKQTELELERQRNELAHFSRVTMLGELSGSLAHELNQPLAAILSNAQAASRFLAKDQPNLDEVREILRDIVTDDKRAGEVIKGLRLLLKKGERRQDLLDVNGVVRDVLRLMNSDILNAGISLSVSLAPELPRITGDVVQLQQVLINLILNACDAMADNALGERKLVVSSERTDAARIRIAVIDHGKGIPGETLERVFEPFFTTKVHGLGLGLSVCRQIIEAHGGRLWCTNNVGRGATFFLALPVDTTGVTRVIPHLPSS